MDKEKQAFEENKFIVINRKHIREMEAFDHFNLGSEIRDAVALFSIRYEQITGKELNQRYIVCNEDEPYAEEVKALILGTKELEIATLKDEINQKNRALQKCRQDINWMLNEGKFLNPFVFGYIDEAITGSNQ